MALRVAALAVVAQAGHHGDGDDIFTMTCGELKQVYKDEECCGEPNKVSNFVTVPKPHIRAGTNPCAGQKSLTQGDPDTGPQAPGTEGEGMDNIHCYIDAVAVAGEQSGTDITAGYSGQMESDIVPITAPYHTTTLCPVNVHWHLGAEHRSEGEFDESGTSPGVAGTPDTGAPTRRRLDEEVRYGYACGLYDGSNAAFADDYEWQHCLGMHVGETYEVHWPHSALGACGTVNQWQSPFYDGVFCHATAEALGGLAPQDIASAVGVQGQVFTIINDEDYYYPDLMRGMLVDAEHHMGQDVAVYSGSTTGTTRNNEVCSAYTPITWQVDRKCHLISASSFDKMCADMKQQRDDMSVDLHAHGARDLVDTALAADNHQDASVGR
jgi:hypothetical protein